MCGQLVKTIFFSDLYAMGIWILTSSMGSVTRGVLGMFSRTPVCLRHIKMLRMGERIYEAKFVWMSRIWVGNGAV